MILPLLLYCISNFRKHDCCQAALDKGKDSEENDISVADCSNDLPENTESVASKMNGLSVSGNDSLVTPPSDSTECSAPMDQVQDIDKKIRALKKKVKIHIVPALGISLFSCLKEMLCSILCPMNMTQNLILSLRDIHIQIKSSTRGTILSSSLVGACFLL